ncbi:MAG: hypothetical protein ACI9DC_004806, partial [Gammaproteobacteria bacterium]
GSAKQLRTFEDHFGDMLITVVLRTSRDVQIENEDIHCMP